MTNLEILTKLEEIKREHFIVSMNVKTYNEAEFKKELRKVERLIENLIEKIGGKVNKQNEDV